MHNYTPFTVGNSLIERSKNIVAAASFESGHGAY